MNSKLNWTWIYSIICHQISSSAHKPKIIFYPKFLNWSIFIAISVAVIVFLKWVSSFVSIYFFLVKIINYLFALYGNLYYFATTDPFRYSIYIITATYNILSLSFGEKQSLKEEMLTKVTCDYRQSKPREPNSQSQVPRNLFLNYTRIYE